MDELLEKLERAYNRATSVCDPIDYQARKRDLLHVMAEYLLEQAKVKKARAELEKNVEEGQELLKHKEWYL